MARIALDELSLLLCNQKKKKTTAMDKTTIVITIVKINFFIVIQGEKQFFNTIN